MTTIEHWINGTLTSAGSTRTAPVFNPATGSEQARVLLAEAADVDTAVAAAAKAFETWGNSADPAAAGDVPAARTPRAP